MSEIKVTKADLSHVMAVMELATWLLEEYPELVSKDEEEEIAIVNQWLMEKLG